MCVFRLVSSLCYPPEPNLHWLPNEWQASPRPYALTKARCRCDNREPQGECKPALPSTVHIYFPYMILFMCWKCLRVSGLDLWTCWQGEPLFDKDIIMRKWTRKRPTVWSSLTAKLGELCTKAHCEMEYLLWREFIFPYFCLNRKSLSFISDDDKR